MPQAKTTRLWGCGLHVEVVGVRNGVRTKVVMKNSHPSMDRWGVNAYYNNVGIPLSFLPLFPFFFFLGDVLKGMWS